MVFGIEDYEKIETRILLVAFAWQLFFHGFSWSSFQFKIK